MSARTSKWPVKLVHLKRLVAGAMVANYLQPVALKWVAHLTGQLFWVVDSRGDYPWGKYVTVVFHRGHHHDFHQPDTQGAANLAYPQQVQNYTPPRTRQTISNGV
jgi:hypothetical protein